MNIEEIKQFARAEAQKNVLPGFAERPRLDHIARLIDHTQLKPDATPAQIEILCAEAKEFGFAAVCVNPIYVPLCAKLLSGAVSRICAVAGFPLGAIPTRSKAAETRVSLEDGADEIDMVLPVGLLRAGELQAVQDDIQAVAEVCHQGGALLKVIFETCLLDREQKIIACLLSGIAGADFVKTSTGFSTAGAALEDVALMRAYAKPPLRIKAAGGIRNAEQALAFYQAGADRIGTSGGVNIVREYNA